MGFQHTEGGRLFRAWAFIEASFILLNKQTFNSQLKLGARHNQPPIGPFSP
jgi:hypothetical protein